MVDDSTNMRSVADRKSGEDAMDRKVWPIFCSRAFVFVSAAASIGCDGCS